MIRVGAYVATDRFEYDKYAIIRAYSYCRRELGQEVPLANSVEFIVDSVEDFTLCVHRCNVCFIDAENVSDKHGWWVDVARIAMEMPQKKFVIFVPYDKVTYSTVLIKPNVKFIPFDCIESCMEDVLKKLSKR